MANKTNYGRIAIIPRGNFKGDVQYDVGDVVSYEGSSYLAHSKPPLATLPTDTKYWQVSAQGAAAIADTKRPGIVKPDGHTITVEEDGTIACAYTKTTTERTLLGTYEGGLKVNSVSGECEQFTTTGKNILDCSGLDVAVNNGVTFTPIYKANGELECINVNGTPTIDTYYRIGNVSLEAGKYIASGSTGGSDTTYRLVFYGMPESFLQTNNPIEFEISTAISRYVDISVTSGYTMNNIKFYPMICLADNEDKTYEPYTGGIASPNPEYTQEIKSTVINEIKTCRKNLMECRGLVEKTKNGITFTPVYNDNEELLYVNVNGTSTSGSNITYPLTLVEDIDKFVGNKVTGCVPGDTSSHCIVIGFYNANKKWENELYDISGNGVTLSNNYHKFDVSILVRGGATVSNVKFYPMIYDASKCDNTYEPYIESTCKLSTPITLNGIGEYKDKIVEKDGAWGVERNIAEIIFDGSDDEGWQLVDESLIVYGTPFGKIPLCKNGEIQKCTHLIYSHNYTDKTFKVESGRLYFRNTDYLNLDDLKTDLSTHPVTVMYQLAEPTFEPLPLSDQIALNSLKTFDNITYITTDAELEPTIEVEYGVSKAGSRFLENENRISVNESGITQLNNPTGTYTGNGDSTTRMIATDGAGSVCMIRSDGSYMGFATAVGCIMFNCTDKTTTYYGASEVKFVDGILTIATASSLVNNSGSTYTYNILS